MIKSKGVFLCVFLVAMLAISVPSFAYDNSPSDSVIVPEAIWAAASGGGTWVTELQLTDISGGSVVDVYFWYSGGGGTYRYVGNFWTSPGQYHSIKFSNILNTLYAYDPSFTYYGRSGALWFFTQDTSHKILAATRTVNGSYGKTNVGLNWVDSNCANLGRSMVIQNLTQNANYRTFVGIFNATSGGWEVTVEFRLINYNNGMVGSAFTKTIAPWDFIAFNPFAEAGVPSGYYDNVWLWIHPTASGNTAKGLICYASSANNVTNDTAAHIAVQFQ